MKKTLITINITNIPYSDFLDALIMLVQNKSSSYVCISNVHMCIEAYYDPTFAELVNNADLATPDGVPLAKAFKLLYNIEQERVAGMDLLPDVLKLSEKKGIGVFFYGGAEEMLAHTLNYCSTKFPDLKVKGCISPPFRPLTNEEESNYIYQINNSGAKFVFVALGCPKQEKWMASMKGRINACMIGIGGALPVMVGLQKRAPLWMQKASLEWLYRLMQEPRRLFKRYAVTNSIFIYLLFKQWAKQGFKPVKN